MAELAARAPGAPGATTRQRLASDADPAPIVWRPSPPAVEGSQLARFARSVGREHAPYEALHRWSVSDLETFWDAVWTFTDVIGDRSGPTLRIEDGHRMSGARFFPEAELNLAENLLRGPDDRLAVTAGDEAGRLTQLTMGELRTSVGRTQHALHRLGVAPGDRVAGILPDDVDALVALLATTAIGAIWTGCSPDLGSTALLDRLGQVDPVVLVASPSHVYHGRRHDLRDRLRDVVAALPSVRHVVLTGDVEVADRRRVARGPDGAGAGAANVHALSDLRRDQPATPWFPRLPFAHPAYILTTSGTTGAPKCIVHSAGGALLTHLKEHVLHGDVRPGDRLAYATSTAWMMYHWQVSALAAGASLVLHDGAPLPRTASGDRDVGTLWRLAERARVTHLGVSPGYLRVVQDAGYRPADEHDLSALRMVVSAGAPLQPSQYHWVRDAVGPDPCLASISGGTEILGCFVMGNPTLPVRAGEIQGPALGMAVAAVDDRGVPVVGRTGDLVCTEPFPSMPLRFWGPDGERRYRATYLEERPEVWTHGDVAEFRASGGVVIHGRADTTLKPGGVRIGTAEIYRVVEDLPVVEDAIAVGRPCDGGEEVWLFVALPDGLALDGALADTIRSALRTQASPRHVPAQIRQVPAIPYTHNGKKVEAAVRDLLAGREVGNRASLRDPDALDAVAAAAGVEVGADA